MMKKVRRIKKRRTSVFIVFGVLTIGIIIIGVVILLSWYFFSKFDCSSSAALTNKTDRTINVGFKTKYYDLQKERVRNFIAQPGATIEMCYDGFDEVEIGVLVDDVLYKNDGQGYYVIGDSYTR